MCNLTTLSKPFISKEKNTISDEEIVEEKYNIQFMIVMHVIK